LGNMHEDAPRSEPQSKPIGWLGRLLEKGAA
jgi:hypothetical protein